MNSLIDPFEMSIWLNGEKIGSILEPIYPPVKYTGFEFERIKNGIGFRDCITPVKTAKYFGMNTPLFSQRSFGFIKPEQTQTEGADVQLKDIEEQEFFKIIGV